MVNKKLLDSLWYKIQDEDVAIKNLGKEFEKRALKQKVSKKLIKKYLKDW